jgi:hypothetical protein
MSEDLKLYAAAADEASDAMAKLGIQGSTVKHEVNVVAKVTFKLPSRKAYFMNSDRIHNKEVELMDKYPTVKFDFDIEFTGK